MRLIRFRARSKYKLRDPEGNFCYAMLYGSLVHRGGDCYYIVQYEADYTGHARQCLIVVDPATVGQYTGLTDKNGKEIYEGDILDVHIPCNSIGKEEHRTRVVVWNEKYARFEFQDKKGDCIADSVGAKYSLVYYMVVGNIHDNPELLEGGDQ